MHRNRLTKIVATLGPASSTESMIRELFERGVDVFRLNFSHGTHETHQNNIQFIRNIEKSLNIPIGILADLQGPKLRVGKFENQKESLTAGQKFIFDRNETLGNSQRVTLPHPEIFEAAKRGDELLVDDGKLAFRVDNVTSTTIETTALYSGVISNNKGVNLPSTHLPIDILTDKDKTDLEFALAHSVDFIALSFVQTAEDIISAKNLIQSKAKIVAKIEKPQAIDNLKAILKETDCVMIARGDLGVEIPPEQLPPLQRRILRETQALNKPVIVATQMLESMIQAPKPTRAEVSDVATAVYLGTDAVMLSAESASGQFPRESVEIMDRIIFHAEKDRFIQKYPSTEYQSSITKSAIEIAEQQKAKVIAILSNSFSAVASVASKRPNIPILVITSDQKLYNQLVLQFGVFPYFIDKLPKLENPEILKELIQEISLKQGITTKSSESILVLIPETFKAKSFSGLFMI